MILFILIFFAIVIAVGVTAVVGFSIYLKRRRNSLSESQIPKEIEPPVYRSLFEPDDDELRALEHERQAQAQAEKLETEQKALREKVEKVAGLEKIWIEKLDKPNTIQLLFSAAASGSAKIFSETAESVIKNWQENKIETLNAADLAALLDSHLNILPQQERASGELFWLKQEITNLQRRKSEDK